MNPARAALALALLLLCASCRTPPPAAVPLPEGDPRPQALLDAWNAHARSRQALRGTARLAVDGGEGDLRIRGKQRLVVERPARLRVEILGLLGQTVAVLVTDAGHFEWFEASRRTYESGQVRPDLLWELAGLALTPEEAVDVLLGAPPPLPGLELARALQAGDDEIRLELADAEGAVRQQLVFDAAGRLRAFALRDAMGALRLQARFDDYADVSGEPVAHAISLDTPAGNTRAEVSLRDVELNPELPAGVFGLRIAPPS